MAKRNIHLEDSYRIWSRDTMACWIMEEVNCKNNSNDCEAILNRSWDGMYLEWNLHNIGYWLTLPLISIEYFKKLNERFKHLDLEEL